MLGYERHLAVSGRFDVYVGAEFGYKINKYSGDLAYNEFTTNYDADKKRLENDLSGRRIRKNNPCGIC